MTSDSERYERGAAALTRIHGEIGMSYVAQLASFAPAFADMLVEFAYGDIYARPGLDPKSRQIATIASLTTLGSADHELQIHIRSALNVGCTRAEIVEVIMQMAVYAGFPRALSGLSAARAAFAAVDATKDGAPTSAPPPIE
jgi:4-carboxymuconolactone decarboxylase